MALDRWRGTGFLSLAIALVGVAMVLATADSMVREVTEVSGDVVPSVPLTGGPNGGPDDEALPPTLSPEPTRDCGALQPFASKDALTAYLRPVPMDWQDASPVGGAASPAASGGYSDTNNQVAGVDEADIVKTDGRNLYTVSNNTVVIMRAYPPDRAGILARIPSVDRVVGLFLHGSRLAVLATSGYAYGWYDGAEREEETRVTVYDVSVPSRPWLVRSVIVEGAYVGARLYLDQVYLVVYAYARVEGSEPVLPAITFDGVRGAITYADVGRFSESRGGALAIVLAVDVTRDLPPVFAAVFTASSSLIHVSTENVYVANTGWSHDRSTIHKFAVSPGGVSYVCSAGIPGHVLNQFSMDEHRGSLRVATTVGFPWDGESRNNVFVLDAVLNVTGRLEGLARGEQIHSARFLGDRAYLVTFKKTDPFFVIDLSDPTAPKVLGYLKIPGYSDYLHPYDATHVIGLGKDAYDMGDFAWYQGLKLSLFDVADVSHPSEVATIRIGDRGTWSEALYDHKAFLFVPSRNLVVVPVHLFVIDPAKYPGGAPPETFGEFVWQGAYVLSVTADRGIEVRAQIAHTGDFGSPGSFGYGWGPFDVQRSLYIEDVLYTVSQSIVKAHSLDTFVEVASVDL